MVTECDRVYVYRAVSVVTECDRVCVYRPGSVVTECDRVRQCVQGCISGD